MGKFLRHSFLILLAGISGLIALSTGSCNTSGCLDNGSAIPLAGFYSSTTADSIALDSLNITGEGAAEGATILTPGNAASSVYLPMRLNHNSVEWIIEYNYRDLGDPFPVDRITIDYEAIPYFASEECGAMYWYRITSMRHTNVLIDSIILTDSLITNIDRETIRIYFRTADGGGEQ